MNTSSLSAALNQLAGRRVPYYVVPADGVKEAVKLERFPIICIVNTKVHAHQGEHWVCFFVLSSEKTLYFDSFGEDIDAYPEIVALVKNVVRESHVAYQSEN